MWSRLPAPCRPRAAAPGVPLVRVRLVTWFREGTRRAGFGVVAVAFTVAVAFSTVPTPLYPLYERRDGFGAFTVTVVFAVYAVGVVAGLVFAGHLSDRAGRRPVLVAALLSEVAAASLFLAWPALPGLLAARFVTGLGVGTATPTATAYLQDLHARARPGEGPGRFETVSSAANIGGLGVGPLVAGLLAAYAPAPVRTPYAVFAVLLATAAGLVLALPETVARPARPSPYRVQRVRVHGGPVLFGRAVACAWSGLAVFGLFTSLAPGFVVTALHQDSPAVAGSIVFGVFAAAVPGELRRPRERPAPPGLSARPRRRVTHPPRGSARPGAASCTRSAGPPGLSVRHASGPPVRPACQRVTHPARRSARLHSPVLRAKPPAQGAAPPAGRPGRGRWPP
ncbi:MFS transporter [Streptomyces sp. SID2955]|nr:MFS transporter [Streptomyces sp. SID2955]